MKKSFEQRKNESINPFIRLYFEILSRFHKDNYELAYESMGVDLQRIYSNLRRFDLLTENEIAGIFDEKTIIEITEDLPF